MNTATVTRAEVRRAIDRLAAKIGEHQNAAYQRGAAVDLMESDPIAYDAAVAADEDARRACWDELERVRSLVEGLVLSRDRAADAAWMPGPIGGPSL